MQEHVSGATVLQLSQGWAILDFIFMVSSPGRSVLVFHSSVWRSRYQLFTSSDTLLFYILDSRSNETYALNINQMDKIKLNYAHMFCDKRSISMCKQRFLNDVNPKRSVLTKKKALNRSSLQSVYNMGYIDSYEALSTCTSL